MTFLTEPPTIVRFSLTNQLPVYDLYWLEYDLQHVFPGVRLVAVRDRHCDWEGLFKGEVWTEHQNNFLIRSREKIEVTSNPPDPLLKIDIYNPGLRMNPTMPLYLKLKDVEFEWHHLRAKRHGPIHELGGWWVVIERDRDDSSVLCLPALPPVSSYDFVPRFLYHSKSILPWKEGLIEYWCPTCWEDSYSMEGVTKIALTELLEPQSCVICERDFCVDDAHAPEWAAYSHRSLWRRPDPK